MIGSKFLQIRFDRIDGIIRIYDGPRYLTLFGTKKYDTIYGINRYLTTLENFFFENFVLEDFKLISVYSRPIFNFFCLVYTKWLILKMSISLSILVLEQ